MAGCQSLSASKFLIFAQTLLAGASMLDAPDPRRLDLHASLRDPFGDWRVRIHSQRTTLFVTHDLGALAPLADRVAVMYAGRMVEQASARELYATPLHPYTAGLLRSLPRLDLPLPPRLPAIPGQPPNLAELPAGCAFAPRCPLVHQRCSVRPDLRMRPPAARSVACHFEGTAAQLGEAWT